jgi:Fe-S cluster assembly protein SufD
MKKIHKYDQPGKYEVTIPFVKVGEKSEWVFTIDGRAPGEYELRVVAEHTVSDTEGRVTLRAVAGKGAVVRLFGMIKIGKRAQRTNDFLELRILALDKSARGVVEPELEIEANNVKASHAASVGQVDSEQLQYLMSRGLRQAQAEDLIVEGFLRGE